MNFVEERLCWLTYRSLRRLRCRSMHWNSGENRHRDHGSQPTL